MGQGTHSPCIGSGLGASLPLSLSCSASLSVSVSLPLSMGLIYGTGAGEKANDAVSDHSHGMGFSWGLVVDSRVLASVGRGGSCL